jgi:hypothetical protein
LEIDAKKHEKEEANLEKEELDLLLSREIQPGTAYYKSQL